MPKTFGEAESVEKIAQTLIPSYHPDLATARIKYLFVDKAPSNKGRPVRGKVSKVSGSVQFLIDADFLIVVSLDLWNESDGTQREALVDHLLERCTGEENEESGGEIQWKIREPDVHEFTSILRRHGAWNSDLAGFASVAHEIDIDTLVQEVVTASQGAAN